ncbi:MAG: GrpB family protein [Anaerolineae bacterium]|nr:GrpB family protein [Anaerolineae bacterium]
MKHAALSINANLSLPAAETDVSQEFAGALVLGVLEGKVQLVPHNPLWQTYFDLESHRLYAALGAYVKEIRHIGSTAIPGIYAKPILDVMVGLVNIADVRHCEALLVALGYTYEGEQAISGWHFFKKKAGNLTTHHLHVVEWNGSYWLDHVLFQEYLFRHPEVAEAYESLKLALEKKHADNREAYTRDKTDFINKVTEMAYRVQQYHPSPNGWKREKTPQ